MKKLIRVATVPVSLSGLLQGQLKFMSQHYEVIGVSSAAGDILESVTETEGIKVIPVEMTRKITPFQDLKAVYQLYKVFKKEKPFIVHSITPKAGLLSMMAAYLARVPHRMHSFTGLIFPYREGFLQQLLILMDKILCFCATVIYPEGEGVKKDLIKFKITSKPLRIVANGGINGTDISYFDPKQYSDSDAATLRSSLGIAPTDFVFIFVGRLVTDKGINELITVYKDIGTKYPNSKLLLVGPPEKDLDPLLPETEAEIETNSNIIAVGWQNDVRPYFSISNALVFPSYREGFPNVVIQSGAMGLPSIVTDISGCNEIVTDQVNGIIVKSKDCDTLHAAMEKMIVDPDFVAKTAKDARTIVSSQYERKHVWNSFLQEYQNLENEAKK